MHFDFKSNIFFQNASKCFPETVWNKDLEICLKRTTKRSKKTLELKSKCLSFIFYFFNLELKFYRYQYFIYISKLIRCISYLAIPTKLNIWIIIHSVLFCYRYHLLFCSCFGSITYCNQSAFQGRLKHILFRQ